MIHYHGTPITPATASATVLSGRHAFVSFAEPRDLEIAVEVCQSFAVDNGAFSAWRSGSPVTDWLPYYRWADHCSRYPSCDFAIIPDVIGGSERENDRLVKEWPLPGFGCPVWHLHETTARLEWLAREFGRVALGSSGAYSDPGSPAWWRRIGEAMRVVCFDDGRPRVKLHGLRMLDPELVRRIPFASADSTNVARNTGLDGAWGGRNAPPTKEWRAVVLASRIEAAQSPDRWKGPPEQFTLEVA